MSQEDKMMVIFIVFHVIRIIVYQFCYKKIFPWLKKMYPIKKCYNKEKCFYGKCKKKINPIYYFLLKISLFFLPFLGCFFVWVENTVLQTTYQLFEEWLLCFIAFLDIFLLMLLVYESILETFLWLLIQKKNWIRWVPFPRLIVTIFVHGIFVSMSIIGIYLIPGNQIERNQTNELGEEQIS
mmetsp:Transcript_35430/g.70901  ORF Transcript_35430/g.70901 Transcript_35430/m.70901 type:complete len:182 (+) Transcript_35430:4653-5198(+)